MFPILFELGGVPIQAYGFFIALGYLAALLLTRRLAVSRGLLAADFSDLVFFCLVAGIVGARLLFVLTNLSYFRENPQQVFSFWGGGLVFYGGLFLVLPSLFLIFRSRRIPWRTGFDILAPGLALAHGLGRIGCLAAGCCHGRYCEYPWAIRLHSELVEPSLRGLPIHPVQVYESLGLLTLCLFLLFLFRRKYEPGTVALAYASGYALLRFFIETFRGDPIRGGIGGISTSQLASVLLFASAIAVFLYRRRRDSGA